MHRNFNGNCYIIFIFEVEINIPHYHVEVVPLSKLYAIERQSVIAGVSQLCRSRIYEPAVSWVRSVKARAEIVHKYICLCVDERRVEAHGMQSLAAGLDVEDIFSPDLAGVERVGVAPA